MTTDRKQNGETYTINTDFMKGKVKEHGTWWR